MSNSKHFTKYMVPKLRFKKFDSIWNEGSLCNFTKIYDGTHTTPDYVTKGVPFYSVEHVTSDNFETTKFISPEVFKKENKRVKIDRNDILMTRIGDIGTVRLIDWDVLASFYVSLALIKPVKETISSFLVQYFRTNIFQRELWKRTIHVAFPKKINLGEIGETLIRYPSREEQIKLSAFFSLIDSLEKNKKRQKILHAKYKNGLMQMIFSKENRFKKKNGNNYLDWDRKRADSIFENISNKNHKGDLPLLAVTQDKGIIFRDNLKLKIHSSVEGVMNYKIIEPGDFVISLRSFQGGIECSTVKGISSPAYTILRNKIEISTVFFKYYFKRESFIKILNSLIYGIRDGKQIGFDDFKTLLLDFPSIPEQTRIADLLLAIDAILDHSSRQIKQMEDWKKGLLQQMFV